MGKGAHLLGGFFDGETKSSQHFMDGVITMESGAGGKKKRKAHLTLYAHGRQRL